MAFFTLIERKFIGLSHYRKGPNKVILRGLSQPISDALKLLRKERIKIRNNKIVIIFSGPIVALFLIIIVWCWYDRFSCVTPSSQKIIPFFALLGIIRYRLLLIRWGSNRKYALLGGHRGVAQILSYEVTIFLIALIWFFLQKSFRFYNLRMIQQLLWGCVSIPLLFYFWVTLCLAESNRTPFDLSEGEREIVSGFNIEYGGGLFAFIFIVEYGIILAIRYITTMIFLSRRILAIKTLLIRFIYIWVRCSLPRVRYNDLIIITWKIVLPLTIFLLRWSIIFN